MCDFTIHSNGDDASKSGFVWKKGTANWIMNNKLEGPDMGNVFITLSCLVTNYLNNSNMSPPSFIYLQSKYVLLRS